jgi:hypothetical protein
MIDVTLIMLAIIIPSILLAVRMAWRSPASNAKAGYPPTGLSRDAGYRSGVFGAGRPAAIGRQAAARESR